MAFEVVDFKSPFQIQTGIEKEQAGTEALKADAAFKLAQVDAFKQKREGENAFLAAERARLSGATPPAFSPKSNGVGWPGNLVERLPDTNLAYEGEDGPAVRLDPKINLGVFSRLSQAQAEGEGAVVQQAHARYINAKGQYESALKANNYETSVSARKALDDSLKDLAAAQGKASEAALKDIGAMQSQLGSVTDEESLMAVVNNAAVKHGAPQIIKSLLGAGLVDPVTGKLVYNPIAIKNLQKSLLTTEQQVQDSEREFRRWFDQIKEQRQQEQFEISKRQADQRIAIDRGNLALRGDEFTYRTGVVDPLERAKAINAKLSEAGVVKILPDLEKNQDFIDRVIQPHMARDAGGHLRLVDDAFKKITMPEQQSIMRAFTEAQHNFTRHGSDVYSDKEFNKMAGYMERVGKSLSTWGEGTPYLNNRTLIEVAQAHAQMVNAANAAAVSKSLEAVERGAKTGANIDGISFAGSLKKAIQTGFAEIKGYDGNGNAYVHLKQKGVTYKLPKGVGDAN